MNLDQGLWSYLLLFIAGFAATEPWRYLGVLLSKNLNADSEILKWLRAVSTALIAGLVTRMILFPFGVLAEVPLSVRLTCFALGIIVYFLAGQKLFAGVFAGAGVLMSAAYLTV